MRREWPNTALESPPVSNSQPWINLWRKATRFPAKDVVKRQSPVKTAKKQKVFWKWAMNVVLVIVIASFFVKDRRQLALSYVSQSNQAGRSVAFFTISNAGNVSLICQGSGDLEIFGQSTKETVGCEMKHSELQPGENETVQVSLPGTMVKPWRFTIYFGRNRSRYTYRLGQSTSSDWIREPTNTALPPAPIAP